MQIEKEDNIRGRKKNRTIKGEGKKRKPELTRLGARPSCIHACN